MKLAITDACIFIDLIELRLTSEFFQLPLEIHTSLDVYNELYIEQKEILKAFNSVGKLLIHNLSAEDKIEIQKEKFPKSLSDVDKTVIFLARKFEAIILSSDKTVRNYANSEIIPFHGMLWIFDELVDKSLLSTADAITKIKELFSNNIVYQNNAELVFERNKRIHSWEKE